MAETSRESFPLATADGRCPYSAICVWKQATEPAPPAAVATAVDVDELAHLRGQLSVLHAELAKGRVIPAEDLGRALRRAVLAFDSILNGQVTDAA